MNKCEFFLIQYFEMCQTLEDLHNSKCSTWSVHDITNHAYVKSNVQDKLTGFNITECEKVIKIISDST